MVFWLRVFRRSCCGFAGGYVLGGVVLAVKLVLVFACFLAFLGGACKIRRFCSSDSGSVLVGYSASISGLWPIWVLFRGVVGFGV